jgi:1-deoxy-D-xylulose-5-phosphate synthase
MQHLAWRGLLDAQGERAPVRIRPMTLPDRFIDHDSHTKQLAEAGLSARDIVQTAVDAIATVGLPHTLAKAAIVR